MRSVTMIFSAIAFAAFAAGASAQVTSPTGQPQTKPATESGSKPAGGLENYGNGLAFGMSAADANRMFVQLDANGDGYVSLDEFTATGDTGQRFPGCDTNGDQKLSRAEFVQCAQRPPTTGGQ